mmetsp:Transcript_3513/g.5477  ORF Transcript_3513/g.5477 Transcript_3513/m.5477 type:complete len:104 (-) Transcript_3513:51-362(-)
MNAPEGLVDVLYRGHEGVIEDIVSESQSRHSHEHDEEGLRIVIHGKPPDEILQILLEYNEHPADGPEHEHSSPLLRQRRGRQGHALEQLQTVAQRHTHCQHLA